MATATAEAPTTFDINNVDPKVIEAVELTKSDLATLKALEALMSPEELEKAKLALKVSKIKKQLSGEGKRGREFTTEFSPKAGNVFQAKIVEGLPNEKIKVTYGVEVGDINSHTRTVALKMMVLALADGNSGLSKDWVLNMLKEHATEKEIKRAKKDKVVEAPTNGTENVQPETVSEDEAEVTDSPFSESELADLENE